MPRFDKDGVAHSTDSGEDDDDMGFSSRKQTKKWSNTPVKRSWSQKPGGSGKGGDGDYAKKKACSSYRKKKGPTPKPIPVCSTSEKCRRQDPPPPGPKHYDLDPRVESIMKEVMKLPPEACDALQKEIFKKAPTTLGMKLSLKNFMGRKLSELSKAARAIEKKESKDDSSKEPEPEVPIVRAPATEVGLICRSDLIAKSHILFLDIEKLTMLKFHPNDKHMQLAGDIAIVNREGTLVFWAYIQQDRVCSYATEKTGLSEDKSMMGYPIGMIHCILKKELHGQTICGVNIGQDLKALEFNVNFSKDQRHGECEVTDLDVSILDLHTFYHDSKGDNIGLAWISEHFFGVNIQEEYHSSIRDARLTATMYNRMLKMQDNGSLRFDCPEMDEIRTRKEFNPKLREKAWPTDCSCSSKNRQAVGSFQNFSNVSCNIPPQEFKNI